jgi:hypothetical protein
LVFLQQKEENLRIPEFQQAQVRQLHQDRDDFRMAGLRLIDGHSMSMRWHHLRNTNIQTKE